MNLADPAAARMMTEREFKRIFDDIVYEIAKHVDIQHVFIIKSHNTAIGAEPGSVFLVTANKDESLKVIRAMRDTKYNGRECKMVCIPEDTYQTYFAKLGQ